MTTVRRVCLFAVAALLAVLAGACAGPEPTPTPTSTPTVTSGPEKLSPIGWWPFGPSWAVEVAKVAGKPYAFLGSGGGVYILDVSQADTPWLVSDAIRTPGIVVGLHVTDGVLYVAALEAGLYVYDVSDPTEPLLLSTLPAEGWLWDVVVQGNYAYLVDDHWPGGSLAALDVSSPGQLKAVGRYEHDWRAFHVAVQGEYAYLEGEALVTVDVSDPSDLKEVDRFEPYGRPAIGDDERLYLAAGYRAGIQVLDIGREGVPTLLGAYDTMGEAEAMVVRDGYAYLADGGMGLMVYDVSDPSSIHEVGTVPTGGYAMDVSLLGDHAYVADYGGGLRIVNITSPGEPWEVAHFAVPSDSLDIAVRWPYAFVATRLTGVKVLDLSDPTMPHEVAAWDTPGEAHAVLLDEDHLYVADWGTGVLVLDVSDPEYPRQVASVATEGMAQALYLRGDRLYVTGYVRNDADVLTVLDASDGTALKQAGRYAVPESVVPGDSEIRTVVVADGRIYMLVGASPDGYSSLLVLDARDDTLDLLGSHRIDRGGGTTWDELVSLAVVGDHAYVGARPSGGGPAHLPPVPMTRGIMVLDVSDPGDITEVGRIEIFVPDCIEVAGDKLYAADHQQVLLLDISNPTSPSIQDVWGETTSISSVHADGSYAFLTRGKTHLQAISGGRLWGSGVVILGETGR